MPRVLTFSEAIHAAAQIDGAVGAALVDAVTGMSLGEEHGPAADQYDMNLYEAATANVEVVRSYLRVLEGLGAPDRVEDIVVTLGRQFHVMHVVCPWSHAMYLYVVLDRERANLALTRRRLEEVSRAMSSR
jgi:hypothetical protein